MLSIGGVFCAWKICTRQQAQLSLINSVSNNIRRQQRHGHSSGNLDYLQRLQEIYAFYWPGMWESNQELVINLRLCRWGLVLYIAPTNIRSKTFLKLRTGEISPPSAWICIQVLVLEHQLYSVSPATKRLSWPSGTARALLHESVLIINA